MPRATEIARASAARAGARIFRNGMLWPEHPRCDQVRRSAPVEGAGETRPVPVLDPIVEPQDVPDRARRHENDEKREDPR
ncbi:MAG: hypothetical protein AAF677_00170 [Pseudomonadota bacterium]